MKKLYLSFLLLFSPIVSADMDDLCFIYIKEFGTNDILSGIENRVVLEIISYKLSMEWIMHQRQ